MKRIGEETLSAFAKVRHRLLSAAGGDARVASCVNGLAHLERCLARRPRVVVVGEANSGKTSMINSLLGAQMLPTGVLSNTQVPVTVRYGERHEIVAVTAQESIRLEGADALSDLSRGELVGIEISVPHKILENFDIVDTQSGADVRECVGNADVVVWCTLASRAWMETERSAWQKVPYRCKRNALLVATHADGVSETDALAKVGARLKSCTKGAFERVFFVSSSEYAEDSAFAAEIDGCSKSEEYDAAALLEEIGVMAADVMQRRVSAAKRIAERLARVAYGNVDDSAQIDTVPEVAQPGVRVSQWEGMLENVAGTATPPPLPVLAKDRPYPAEGSVPVSKVAA